MPKAVRQFLTALAWLDRRNWTLSLVMAISVGTEHHQQTPNLLASIGSGALTGLAFVVIFASFHDRPGQAQR